MPNLNLIDEEGGEESLETVAAPVRRRGGGGGGGGVAKILVVVLILVLVVAGVFLLNKYGIVKLWGKKAAPTAAVTQTEPFPAEPFQQPQATPDTSQMAAGSGIDFVETPPIEEQPKAEGAQLGEGMLIAGAKLADMKGNYTIQVSAWKDKATADKYVKMLEDAGYPAYVAARDLKGSTWYTVRIGRYPTIKDARNAVQDFALEIRSHYWIDRVASR